LALAPAWVAVAQAVSEREQALVLVALALEDDHPGY
jgi:hypothetical protein